MAKIAKILVSVVLAVTTTAMCMKSDVKQKTKPKKYQLHRVKRRIDLANLNEVIFANIEKAKKVKLVAQK